METVGDLNSNDFSFLKDNTAIEYAEQIHSQIQTGTTLGNRFAESSYTIIKILESLLEFNHQYRTSAK